MATEYTITYTYTGQTNTSSKRSVAFSKFKASGNTDKNIGQIISIKYEHWHTSTKAMVWNLRGRLVFDGGSVISNTVGINPSGDCVKFVNTFTNLPTAEQFKTITAVETLNTQGTTGLGDYYADLYWRATSDKPMKLIVTFIEEPPVTYAPSIDKFEVQRVDANGVVNDEGEYVATTLKLSLGDSSGLDVAQCKIFYAANVYPEVDKSDSIDAIEKVGIQSLISGINRNTSILTGVWKLASTWNFAVAFIAGEEIAIATASVARGTTSFHISDEPGGGAAVGGLSSGTTENPKFESYAPAFFYGGVEGLTNYSNTEVDTGGKWIDGKPIYRYVLINTTSISGAQAQIGALPSAPETVVQMRGILNSSNGSSYRPIPYAYYGSNNWSSCAYIANTNKVYLQLGSSYSGNHNVILVVDYTKK